MIGLGSGFRSFLFGGRTARIRLGLGFRGVLIATDVGLLLGGVKIGCSGCLLKGCVPSCQEVCICDTAPSGDAYEYLGR